MNNRKWGIGVLVACCGIAALVGGFSVASYVIMRGKSLPQDYPLCKVNGKSAAVDMKAVAGQHASLEMSFGNQPPSAGEWPPKIGVTVDVYEKNHLIGSATMLPDPKVDNPARRGGVEVRVFELDGSDDLLCKMAPGKSYHLELKTDAAAPDDTWLWLSIFQRGAQHVAGPPVDVGSPTRGG